MRRGVIFGPLVVTLIAFGVIATGVLRNSNCPNWALPSPDAMFSCVSSRNIDYSIEMKAHTSLEDFEVFVTTLEIGNENRIDDLEGYLFERGEGADGEIFVREEYGSRIHTSVVWHRGTLTYLSYSL